MAKMLVLVFFKKKIVSPRFLVEFALQLLQVLCKAGWLTIQESMQKEKKKRGMEMKSSD